MSPGSSASATARAMIFAKPSLRSHTDAFTLSSSSVSSSNGDSFAVGRLSKASSNFIESFEVDPGYAYSPTNFGSDNHIRT